MRPGASISSGSSESNSRSLDVGKADDVVQGRKCGRQAVHNGKSMDALHSHCGALGCHLLTCR